MKRDLHIEAVYPFPPERVRALCRWVFQPVVALHTAPQYGRFSFGHDISAAFEPERRIYTLRNPHFAEAFTLVNRDRLWDPASPHAQRAASKRAFATALAIVLAAAAVIRGLYDQHVSD